VLTPDELLSTTRAVRRRLDLTRPVERGLIEECLALAQQAPTGGNHQRWSFVVVTDPDRRRALGEIYARAWADYRQLPSSAGRRAGADPERRKLQRRIAGSAAYLAEHMGEVPVLVVACMRPRPENQSTMMLASHYGSILPAVWSFMLAARSRGLGTSWTTVHLVFEEEAAELLGVPFRDVTQVAMIPLAHTVGSEFRPAHRHDVRDVVHWERW
jgi:nitroreductase